MVNHDHKPVLEIWRIPLFSENLPGEVVLRSTRLDLREGVGAMTKRAVRMWAFFLKALVRGGLAEKYSAVLTLAMGPVRYRNQFLLRVKVVVGWLLRRLIVLVAKRNRLPLVVLDLEDNMNVHSGDAVLLKAADLFYKRELAQDIWPSLEPTFRPWVHIGRIKEKPWGEELAAKMKPIPLSAFTDIPEDVPANGEKTYDVFFAGRSRATLGRQLAMDACREMQVRGWKVLLPAETLSLEEYFEAIRSSWLSLSPAGNGWDCYRHYEVASQGGVAVMNYPRILRFAPYLHGETCLYYDDQEDLVAFLERALADRQVLAGIGGRAAAHYREHHTAKKVLASILTDLADVMETA